MTRQGLLALPCQIRRFDLQKCQQHFISSYNKASSALARRQHRRSCDCQPSSPSFSFKLCSHRCLSLKTTTDDSKHHSGNDDYTGNEEYDKGSRICHHCCPAL